MSNLNGSSGRLSPASRITVQRFNDSTIQRFTHHASRITHHASPLSDLISGHHRATVREPRCFGGIDGAAPHRHSRRRGSRWRRGTPHQGWFQQPRIIRRTVDKAIGSMMPGESRSTELDAFQGAVPWSLRSLQSPRPAQSRSRILLKISFQMTQGVDHVSRREQQCDLSVTRKHQFGGMNVITGCRIIAVQPERIFRRHL
jgi:hypothetical protein